MTRKKSQANQQWTGHDSPDRTANLEGHPSLIRNVTAPHPPNWTCYQKKYLTNSRTLLYLPQFIPPDLECLKTRFVKDDMPSPRN
ncbi:hypothetical protein TNCV_618211 [Trichonephila clavipes]|nr:hypothetical protein TNCV_618211 [Trichonephila clavipes]